MPGEYSGKERQSVYQKALVVCHEDEKRLNLLLHKLEQSKLQKYIDYKLEKKKLQKELLQLRHEQMHLMQESRQRQKEKKTIDDLAKENTQINGVRNRNHDLLNLKKKFSFPYVTPTQVNIPKIMKRSLSYESEYYTWTFGLPSIEGPAEAKITSNVGKHGIRKNDSTESLAVSKVTASDTTNSERDGKNGEDVEKGRIREGNGIKLPCIEKGVTKTPNKTKRKTKAKSLSDSKLPPIT
ncbi:uncharacterized protein LOC116602318 [Nematostella vectensis]|uniref:uncharacterized protein LOC116602318 n=1 Tax=Nematostella vectensis TaxID=45351 RepID=UPI00138FCFB0|nr:uncharacterized protein LOC116602318 [Nematostella vectensis]